MLVPKRRSTALSPSLNIQGADAEEKERGDRDVLNALKQRRTIIRLFLRRVSIYADLRRIELKGIKSLAQSYPGIFFENIK